VVNFIVRAVDDILKTEFGLSQGLADTSKTKMKTKVATKATADARSKVKEVDYEQEVHKVQILDPATGTGTFLAEVVKQIHKRFEGQQGIWSNYVENNLIPRLHGFEILMASYAMAHLKLDLLLTETGYKPTKDQRFRVYLTNSLEESHPDAGTLFAHWLSEEANEANKVKRDTPVMVVLGNPPYSGISTNKGEWITNLIDDYKYVDGVHFGERKHWLNDDYVKFIRFGEYFINKNGEGVLVFINNHSFLDNPTFKGMRWHLLNTFDIIYTIDLHGNSLKKEVSPDGSADHNVFDIQQGVSINFFIKNGKRDKGKLAKVFHCDLWGKREFKYSFLLKNNLETIDFKEIEVEKPFLFFVPTENKGKMEYEYGFQINELFVLNGVGMITARDRFCIDEKFAELKKRIDDFTNNNNSDEQIRAKYTLKDTSTFKLAQSRQNLYREKKLENYFQVVAYRPFDMRHVFYNNNVVERQIMKVMQHFLYGENLGLVTKRQAKFDFSYVFLTQTIAEGCLFESAFANNTICPLYLYPEKSNQTSASQLTRIPNLKPIIIQQIGHKIGLPFTNEKETDTDTFAPIAENRLFWVLWFIVKK